MENHLKEHVEYLLCVNIDSVRSVSGGDISRAYLLKTETERFFCKVNYGENALGMFNAEKGHYAFNFVNLRPAARTICFEDSFSNARVLKTIIRAHMF